jgi:hypothetical protein
LDILSFKNLLILRLKKWISASIGHVDRGPNLGIWDGNAAFVDMDSNALFLMSFEANSVKLFSFVASFVSFHGSFLFAAQQTLFFVSLF